MGLVSVPLISYRMPPKAIMRGVSKRLGVTMQYDTFKSVDAGMRALDAQLAHAGVRGRDGRFQFVLDKIWIASLRQGLISQRRYFAYYLRQILP